MTVTDTIDACREARQGLGSVALVPTMGALHAGHLALMRHARSLADHVAVSIFVNPTQFGRSEDYGKYPRTPDADLAGCEAAGVSLVFMPSGEEMYPASVPPVSVDVPSLTDVLEGKHRPGHFRGVCQVVAKLFHIVYPQVAVFGRKDFQQLRVLEAMTAALDLPVEIVGMPTIREMDGLAMSSRNRYLAPEERARALVIPAALEKAKADYDSGVRQANRLVALLQKTLLDPGKLGHVPMFIDYVACVDPMTLRPLDAISGPALVAIAARVGATRLIDNLLLGESAE